jgi:hypothetical protein
MRKEFVDNGTLVMHTGFLMVVINHRYRDTYTHRELVKENRNGEVETKEYIFKFEAPYYFGQPMYLCRPLEWVVGKDKPSFFDNRFTYYQQADMYNEYDDKGIRFAFAAFQKGDTKMIRDFWLFDDEFSVVKDKNKPLTYNYYLAKIKPSGQLKLF